MATAIHITKTNYPKMIKLFFKPTLALLFLAIFGQCQPENKAVQTEAPESTASLLSATVNAKVIDRPDTSQQVEDLISALTVDEKISLINEDNPAIPRLAMPAHNFWNEALHGLGRTGLATVFPQPIALASSFDEQLAFRVANAVSDEARAKYNLRKASKQTGERYASLTFWTPNINLFRDPRWGRGLETYGEDPYLMGLMGGAYVRGLQGNHPNYLKTAACAKHYVVHSGPEEFRHSFDAQAPKLDFYNSYLPAFRKLVTQDRVEAVMTAYNRTYGVPCAGSQFLVQDILRNKWNFDGHLVTDCWALEDFWLENNHGVVGSPDSAAAQVIKNGVSIFCGPDYIPHIRKAYDNGLITENDIDNILRYSLRARWRLGLLDTATTTPWDALSPKVINSAEHRNLAREAAQKSIVLLKNNGVLPISKTEKQIFITGSGATSTEVLLGNYHGISNNLNTILDGITQKVTKDCMLAYRQGYFFEVPNVNPMNYAMDEATSTQGVVIMVMGITTTMEGEEGEAIASANKGDRKSIDIPAHQIEFLKQVKEKSPGKIVAIIVGGSPLDLTQVSQYADAVLMAWYPGEEGGNAVADVLFGDVAPSGCLPITFPESVNQLPPFDDYAMQGRTYRYLNQKPFYPFGYGLSYTTFNYSNPNLLTPTIAPNDTIITVTFAVKNTGNINADEVIQLYVKYPNNIAYQPHHDLKATKRITLKAGEQKTVEMQLPVNQLQYYNTNGEPKLAKGTYKLYVGGNQPDARSVELGLPKPLMVEFEIK